MMNDSVINNDDVIEVSQIRANKRVKKGSEECENIDGEEDVTVTDMIREILEEMKELRIEMAGMKVDLRKEMGDMLREKLDKMGGEIKDEVTKQMKEVKERMEKTEKDITEVNSKLDKKNRDLVNRLDAAENKLKEVSVIMKDLKWKSIDYESRMRRNNLIFYGISEEKQENVIKKIENFLEKELNLSEPVAIQRAHRLGKPAQPNTIGQKAGRPRPIIVNFLDHRQREAIRAERAKLRYPLGISDDLPLEVRKAREKLTPELKDLKQQGKNCSIVWPARLLCEGKIIREVDVTQFANK